MCTQGTEKPAQARAKLVRVSLLALAKGKSKPELSQQASRRVLARTNTVASRSPVQQRCLQRLFEGADLRRGLDWDLLRAGPKLLEVVITPRLGIEHVDDDVAVVE